jgi:4-hydroxybenzoate polyprenyltransferase
MGVKSFPRYLGLRGANALAACFYVVAVALSFLPFLLPVFDRYYGNYVYLGLIVLTDLILLWVCWQLSRRQPVNYSRLRKLSLVALLVGLLGFLIGAFVG